MVLTNIDKMPQLKPTLLLLLFCLCLTLSAQQRYWVANQDTIKLSHNLGQPIHCSEWLKSCTYELQPDQLCLLSDLKIPTQPVIAFATKQTEARTLNMNFVLEQIEAEAFTKLGLNGEGVKVGIIDGGFLKADKNKTLSYFFDHDKIKFYKDYITPDLAPYDGSAHLDDNHGTEVWELIGGYDPEKDIQHGLAIRSDYYLARTDHGAYEKRLEEDLLIEAVEDMFKMDVRLINISLGYNIDYQNASENYRPEQMDGKTTAVAKALEIAAVEKGMLLVISAGNEAELPWRIITTPADAEHVLAVGSSKFNIWDKMDYSSIGPDFTDFVKPDIAVFSTSGTSYSAPVVTGMAACMWQKDSTLTNLEIIDIMKRAGNFYPYPNNLMGYGVPTCTRILEVMKGEELPLPKTLNTTANKVIIKKENWESKTAVVYHKEDETHVSMRFHLRPSDSRLKIKRPEGINYTSVIIGREIIEIIWK